MLEIEWGVNQTWSCPLQSSGKVDIKKKKKVITCLMSVLREKQRRLWQCIISGLRIISVGDSDVIKQET